VFSWEIPGETKRKKKIYAESCGVLEEYPGEKQIISLLMGQGEGEPTYWTVQVSCVA
jgi:hypothetical protein